MKKAPGNSSSPPHTHQHLNPLSPSPNSPTNPTSLPLAQSSEQGFRTLFINQLKDIYWAEQALATLLPQMIRQATSQDLIDALESHLSVTEQQISRCEEIFAAMHQPVQASTCEAMEGIIEEAKEMMKATASQAQPDAAIICAAQKIEHYEIATYGILTTWARQLHELEIANLLEETLNEETEAKEVLTELAAHAVHATMLIDVNKE